MAGDRGNRIALTQGVDQAPQRGVLGVGEGLLVAAFEFDADRIVVAVVASAPRGPAGMPGAPVAGDELDDATGATDVEMRRHLQPGDLGEIWMGHRIEPVEEEVLDPVAAEFAGRQADVVHDHQRDLGAGRALAKIGRVPAFGRRQPAVSQPAHSIPSRSSR